MGKNITQVSLRVKVWQGKQGKNIFHWLIDGKDTRKEPEYQHQPENIVLCWSEISGNR